VEIKFDERDESEDAVDDEELNDDSSLMFAIEMSRNARNRQQQRASSRAAQHVMSEAEVLENQETATKLDCLMDLMLAFLTTRPQQDWDDYYQSLLKAFDVIVLPTHKSKFTQFLMFYFCRAKMEYADHFLQYLFEQMENEERAIQHRQAAASYLGSYVARANYLSPNHVRGVLERLIGWLHTYAERFPSATPDTVRHGLFYAVAQASIYVLTFQHERLFHVVDSGYLKTLNLNRIVYSSLNPLKVCVQSVVNEFIRVAWSHGVRFDNMRQHNKRVLPTKTASGAANVFDAYFPFDPYLLQISSRFISPLYTQWQRRASDDGYGTDGEMELEDQPTSYDQLDEDDATQRDSMMQMMDFGRGSLDSGSGFAMARSFGERRASFSSSFNNGRGSGAFFPGSNGSGNSSPNRFFGDDHDSNGGGSPGSYTGNNGSFWPSR
jgi:RNA polymerase I-specific transcription initiation factor RRN3